MEKKEIDDSDTEADTNGESAATYWNDGLQMTLRDKYAPCIVA